MLADPQYAEWSERRIAAHVGCDKQVVTRVKRRMREQAG
jgi:hypothetical protein